jgi:hypothetical protein
MTACHFGEAEAASGRPGFTAWRWLVGSKRAVDIWGIKTESGIKNEDEEYNTADYVNTLWRISSNNPFI